MKRGILIQIVSPAQVLNGFINNDTSKSFLVSLLVSIGGAEGGSFVLEALRRSGPGVGGLFALWTRVLVLLLDGGVLVAEASPARSALARRSQHEVHQQIGQRYNADHFVVLIDYYQTMNLEFDCYYLLLSKYRYIIY